ncbi:hypothetical protein ABEX25_05340 [Paenibacillus thiaminolyticus]|uniref:hypothetical protein n=1 Tax=Paenibacillus thiaminolyticus TaxID=49283 RepID=UPI003D294944
MRIKWMFYAAVVAFVGFFLLATPKYDAVRWMILVFFAGYFAIKKWCAAKYQGPSVLVLMAAVIIITEVLVAYSGGTP